MIDERKSAQIDVVKLESAARFAYTSILESSVCDEPCGCIDCEMLETLGEALNIPRIGESMKPFDSRIIIESVIEVARLATDQDIILSIVFSTFYVRFFSGRAHELRGDA